MLSERMFDPPTERAYAAGMSEQLTARQKGILDVREHAYKTLKIDSTPSFFVNGTLVRGETSFEGFEKIIKPLLKS